MPDPGSPRLAFVGHAETVTVLVTVNAAAVAAFGVLVAGLAVVVAALLVDTDAFEEVEMALVIEVEVAAFKVEEETLLVDFDVDAAAFEVEVEVVALLKEADEADLEIEVEVEAAAVTKMSVWAPSTNPYRAL